MRKRTRTMPLGENIRFALHYLSMALLHAEPGSTLYFLLEAQIHALTNALKGLEG
jgi:hypothetical protein